MKRSLSVPHKYRNNDNFATINEPEDPQAIPQQGYNLYRHQYSPMMRSQLVLPITPPRQGCSLYLPPLPHDEVATHHGISPSITSIVDENQYYHDNKANTPT